MGPLCLWQCFLECHVWANLGQLKMSSTYVRYRVELLVVKQMELVIGRNRCQHVLHKFVGRNVKTRILGKSWQVAPFDSPLPELQTVGWVQLWEVRTLWTAVMIIFILSEMFGSYFHCQTGVFDIKYEQHYKYKSLKDLSLIILL